MKKRKQKQKYPSQIKYDKGHPTISARLPKERQERLIEMLKSTDMTLTQLLLHFIGEYEPKVTPVEESRKQGFDEGFKRGYLKAQALYAVRYPCVKCGKEIIVNSDDEKTFIRKTMRQNGWHHGDCNSAK